MSLQIGWDLSKNVTGAVPELVGNVAWTSVKFDILHKIFVPQDRGVYLIVVSSNIFKDTEPFCRLNTPAYIGMSTDLRKRFVNHTSGHQADALWRRLGTSLTHSTFWYGVFPEKSKGELRTIEQSLIDVYGSPLNRINSVKIGDTIATKI